jgi:hypothetical protein
MTAGDFLDAAKKLQGRLRALESVQEVFSFGHNREG